MKVSKYIADRIFSFSKRNLSSTVMRLAVTSVALGMAVMIVSISIVTGFKNQIKDKVIGFVAPIHIQALNQNESVEQTPFVVDSRLIDRLQAFDEISHYQMTGDKAGMIKTDDEIQGVVLRGVDKNYDWSYFEKYLLEGEIPSFSDTVRSNDVLISKIVADKLLLKVGDPVRLWFLGEDSQVRGRKFFVKGIFETGLSEFDERFVFGDLAQIRRLNNWTDDQTGRLELWLEPSADMETVNDKLYYRINADLASYTAKESNPQIFDWLALLDTNVILIIVLMLLVSGITVISMLLIIIIERTSTIGLFKAMGATNKFIRDVFLLRTFRILLVGMAIGNVVGLGFCFLQKYTSFISLSPETYYLSAVPIEMSVSTIILLNVSTLLLWLLMLLVPTTVINKITPSRSIRFD